MNLPFLPYAHQEIDEQDIQAVSEALKAPLITRGASVEEFERAVAHYTGAKYAISFNSASSALVAACHAGNVQTGDLIFSTPNTFIITIGAAVERGGTPVFLDIDRSSGNFRFQDVDSELNCPHTRIKTVWMPVHFAGIAVDMKKLDESIADPEALIIEDAAHALGSFYPSGEKVGSCAYSDMTIFSFHPAKTITTGEGGMVLTNREDLNEKLRIVRQNGINRIPPFQYPQRAYPGYYEVETLSSNFHLTDIQAALGLSQLKKLERFQEIRRKLVKAYRHRLEGIEHIRLFDSAFDERTTYHIFVVQIDFDVFKTTRREVMEKLALEGIGTQLHYIPVYSHPVFQDELGDLSSYFPESEAYFQTALTLPLFTQMTESDVDRVSSTLKKVLHLAK